MVGTMRALLAALALLLVPSAAHADMIDSAGASADGQLWSTTKVAQAYWNAREDSVRAVIAGRGGAHSECEMIVPSIAPPPVANDYRDDNGMRASRADGWSATGSCAFSLVPRYANKTRRKRGWWTRLDLRNECVTVVHETGHAIGLEHEDAGRFPVMAQGDIYDEDVPGRCRAWAGRIMREWRASRR